MIVLPRAGTTDAKQKGGEIEIFFKNVVKLSFVFHKQLVIFHLKFGFFILSYMLQSAVRGSQDVAHTHVAPRVVSNDVTCSNTVCH